LIHQAVQVKPSTNILALELSLLVEQGLQKFLLLVVAVVEVDVLAAAEVQVVMFTALQVIYQVVH
jgi:hypothetical protein